MSLLERRLRRRAVPSSRMDYTIVACRGPRAAFAMPLACLEDLYLTQTRSWQKKFSTFLITHKRENTPCQREDC